MPSETAPLLSPGEGERKYYFINVENHTGGTTAAVRDTDGGEVYETLPEGASADEFAPRLVGSPQPARAVKKSSAPTAALTDTSSAPTNGIGSKISGLFSFSKSNKQQTNLIKQRKAPIKIEPKVFFANERTFLAWMHISIILAGGSIAILAFTDSNQSTGSQLYGIALLPVAIAFIVYSMYQYSRRAFMIRTKHPGPYEDTVGPIVLGGVLMLSIICQFAIKLFMLE